MIDLDWKALETRGYVVLHDVVSKELRERAFEDAEAWRREGKDAPPGLSRASRELADVAERELLPLLSEIRRATDIEVTEFEPNVFYFRTIAGSHHTQYWHTDQPPYWNYQNQYQYLNFWMPIVKPDREKSGMNVIPMDLLREKDPAVHDAIRGRGGAVFLPRAFAERGDDGVYEWIHTDVAEKVGPIEDDTLVIECDGRTALVEQKIDVRSLGTIVPVGPGDMIIARGDVLHATQDQDTDRIAFTLRAVAGHRKVTKRMFLGLSPYARRRLTAPKPAFPFFAAKFLGALEMHGRDEMTIHELVEFIRAFEAKKQPQVQIVETVQGRLLDIFGMPPR